MFADSSEQGATKSAKTYVGYWNKNSATLNRSVDSLLRKPSPSERNHMQRPKPEPLRTDEPQHCTYLKNSDQNRTYVNPTSRTSLTTERECYPTSECATPRPHVTSR